MPEKLTKVDSRKVKAILDNALDMQQGDQIGMLKVSDKIVPVVLLNDKSVKNCLGGAWVTPIEHEFMQWELDSPRIIGIFIYQSNTETNAKNFDVSIADDNVNWVGNDLSVGDSAYDAVVKYGYNAAILHNVDGIGLIGNLAAPLNFKGRTTITIQLDSVAGTAQVVETWIMYESCSTGRLTVQPV